MPRWRADAVAATVSTANGASTATRAAAMSLVTEAGTMSTHTSMAASTTPGAAASPFHSLQGSVWLDLLVASQRVPPVSCLAPLAVLAVQGALRWLLSSGNASARRGKPLPTVLVVTLCLVTCLARSAFALLAPAASQQPLVCLCEDVVLGVT